MFSYFKNVIFGQEQPQPLEDGLSLHKGKLRSSTADAHSKSRNLKVEEIGEDGQKIGVNAWRHEAQTPQSIIATSVIAQQYKSGTSVLPSQKRHQSTAPLASNNQQNKQEVLQMLTHEEITQNDEELETSRTPLHNLQQNLSKNIRLKAKPPIVPLHNIHNTNNNGGAGLLHRQKPKATVMAQEISTPFGAQSNANHHYFLQSSSPPPQQVIRNSAPMLQEEMQNVLHASNAAVNGGASIPMNELATVPQSAYMSLVGSQVFPLTQHITMGLPSPNTFDQTNEQIHRLFHEDDATPDREDSQERRETEQLPITKDFLISTGGGNVHRMAREAILMSSAGYISRRELGPLNFHQNVDESENMEGVDVEVSDVEKNVAQRSIRRSVVNKDKLNWSCQFPKGTLTSITTQGKNQITENQRLFVDSNGAMQAINSIKVKKYAINENPNLFDLSVPGKELKYLTVNMLSRNLKMIDIQSNKIETLPEEISELIYLEKLKLDSNLLKKLPSKIRALQNLNHLTFSHNQVHELPLGIEELLRMECLIMNDNMICRLPNKLGNMFALKKLLIHNNLLNRLPVEMYKLVKLREFSSEWLIYMNPPMPKIIRDTKGQVVIDQLKHFCRTFHPSHLTNTQNFEVQQRSFTDFILYFHSIKASDINKVLFGPKKRNLIHQICINAHLYLLKDVSKYFQTGTPTPKDLTSSTTVGQYIDMNARDSEGTTPICFAFRANNQELIDYLVEHPRVNLDIVSPRYGCPLHLCILKHRFGEALQLLETKQVNPHVLNPNGSNAMHILFANYQFDTQGISESLANRLIRKGINVNLVDKNGLTPIHVAIKKNQLKALEFSLSHNAYSNQNQFMQFNFNQQGKKLFTPLHFAVLKSNHEAFIYLMRYALKYIDLLALDELLRTARGLALINSPFFKLLVRLEKQQITANNRASTDYSKPLASFQSVFSPSMRRAMRNHVRHSHAGYHLLNTKSYDFNNTYQLGGSLASIGDKQINLGAISMIANESIDHNAPSQSFGLNHINIQLRRVNNLAKFKSKQNHMVMNA